MKTKKGDFVEILFTGKTNGNVFDSNIEKDLKTLDPEAKPKKTVVVIGEKMVPEGLDDALAEKEPGKEYHIDVPYKKGFGPRKRELVKTLPLSIFTEQKINPRPGASLLMDNQLVRIITVSGARVVTDFNNPLSGKDIEYDFSIKKLVSDEKEKAEALFDYFFRTIPKFSINQDSVTVELPKEAEPLIKMFSEKFKKLLGKELKFKELKDEKKSDESEEKKQEQ